MEYAKARSSVMRTVASASAFLCAAGLLTACQSGTKKADAPPPSSASPSPSPSPTADPTANAAKEVLAAYQGMWAAEVKAFTSGSLKGVDLEKYAQDKALANIKVTAIYYQDHHQVLEGEPSLSPQVTAVDLSSSPKRATIKDCVDTTNFLPVDKTSGKQVDTGKTHRHVLNATAMRLSDRWAIMDASFDRGHAC